MKKITLNLFIGLFLPAILVFTAPAGASSKQVLVRMETSLGNIDLELEPVKAPLTVKNFLGYVDKGDYNGTIFHRVISGFMIQGGGFDEKLSRRPQRAPIRNEADNGLKNLAGTIAMARTGDPHSASNQFFINTVDNEGLDYRSKTISGWGYTVFGKVIGGMDVVRKIESVHTVAYGRFANLPQPTVTIKRVVRIQP